MADFKGWRWTKQLYAQYKRYSGSAGRAAIQTMADFSAPSNRLFAKKFLRKKDSAPDLMPVVSKGTHLPSRGQFQNDGRHIDQKIADDILSWDDMILESEPAPAKEDSLPPTPQPPACFSRSGDVHEGTSTPRAPLSQMSLNRHLGQRISHQGNCPHPTLLHARSPSHLSDLASPVLLEPVSRLVKSLIQGQQQESSDTTSLHTSEAAQPDCGKVSTHVARGLDHVPCSSQMNTSAGAGYGASVQSSRLSTGSAGGGRASVGSTGSRCSTGSGSSCSSSDCLRSSTGSAGSIGGSSAASAVGIKSLGLRGAPARVSSKPRPAAAADGRAACDATRCTQGVLKVARELGSSHDIVGQHLGNSACLPSQRVRDDALKVSPAKRSSGSPSTLTDKLSALHLDQDTERAVNARSAFLLGPVSEGIPGNESASQSKAEVTIGEEDTVAMKEEKMRHARVREADLTTSRELDSIENLIEAVDRPPPPPPLVSPGHIKGRPLLEVPVDSPSHTPQSVRVTSPTVEDNAAHFPFAAVEQKTPFGCEEERPIGHRSSSDNKSFWPFHGPPPRAAEEVMMLAEGMEALALMDGITPIAAADGVELLDPRRRYMAWWLVLTHLEGDEVSLTMPQVCKGLGEMAEDTLTLASVLSCLPSGASTTQLRDECEIWSAYPAGRFVAEGGFKRVYRVRNATQHRFEAMGVIDLHSLRKQGLEGQLYNELWVSYLLSQITRRGRCPHFLRLHQCFQSATKPPESEWGDLDLATAEQGSVSDGTGSTSELEQDDEPFDKPSTRQGRKFAKPTRRAGGACYQYVLMQFAEYGDMEEACRREGDGAWATDLLAPMLFQMIFSLYSSQRELGLRHYDLKLLNFFLAAPRACTLENDEPPNITYGVAGHVYRIPLPFERPAICMLADFGTADISAENMGQPITVSQFTTLENTPPDFLLCGTEARQDYSADSFGLGLCWLHMLTGKAPYEELTASLRCPTELRAALEAVWWAESNDQYGALRQILEDDDAGVIYHTLYRFLCLFGMDVPKDGIVAKSAAWQEVERWVTTSGGKRRYTRDRAQWSIFEGKNAVMAEARRRMALLPGSDEMLRGLVCFEPSRRWTISCAMKSFLFDKYRSLPADSSDGPFLNTVEYMFYLRDKE